MTKIPYKSGGLSVPIGGLLPLFIDPSTDLLTTESKEVFLKTGALSDDVANYPDAYSFEYYLTDGTTIDISGEVSVRRGVAYDGTNLWVLDLTSDAVYEYSLSTGYTGNSFSTAAQTSAPEDITWDGTHFWVLAGGGDDTAFQYTAAGAYTSTSFSVAAETTTPSGITWDGTHFWVLQSNTAVWKYDAAGVYTSTTVTFPSDSPTALAWDGTHFWVFDSSATRLIEYEPDFAAKTGVSFNYQFSDAAYTPLRFDFAGSNIWGAVDNDILALYVQGTYVGDDTARTDTDTEQPIFLRIG